MKLEKITPQETNFARWYTDVVVNGELIDYGPVRGTIILRPLAYGIWENFQALFNQQLKRLEIQNVYLPSLIPQSLMDLEKNHIAGFSPELATLTKVGEQTLHEPLYLRPTSEVLFSQYFKNHGHSYQDFPLKANQWANVIRWEKTTNPFLRNTEFLWQEGHTAHSDPLEARRLTKKILKIYKKILKDYFAIPTISGKKTPREKFAGACSTYTLEAMMKDGKALQIATSHYLAQNFSKPFNLRFKNASNQFEFAYQTSWGISTRLIGALIMTHGDNHGLIIPPYIAPVQIDLLEFNPQKDHQLSLYVDRVAKTLKKFYSLNVDRSKNTLGFKAARSEIRGTPLRVEIGPLEFQRETLTLVPRDTLVKQQINFLDWKVTIKEVFKKIHHNLYSSAQKRLEQKLIFAKDLNELKRAITNHNFVQMYFCCDEADEAQIQIETGATARCILTNEDQDLTINRECGNCQSSSKRRVLFARAY